MIASETDSAAPRLEKGFGAGVGAALAMVLVMAVVRFGFGISSLPEILQGTFLYLVPGDVFEFMIHLLGPGAKVLLLVSVLEGMLLVGGLLGYLFVRRWTPPTGKERGVAEFAKSRYGSGLLYGVYVAVGLVLIMLLLYSLDVLNPRPTDLTPIIVPLIIYGLVFGVALVALLPWPTGAAVVAAPLAADERAVADRRGFLRVAGATAVALVAGGALWGGLTNILKEPSAAGPVAQGGDTGQPLTGANGAVAEEITPTPAPSNTPITAPAVPTNLDLNDNPETAVPAPTDTAVPPTNTGVPPSNTAEPLPTDTAVAAAPSDTPVPAAPTDTVAPPTETAIAEQPTLTPEPTVTTAAVAQVPPTPTAFPAVPVLVPEITPVDNFYITTKNYIDPSVDGGSWSLSIKGMVDAPYSITLEELKALPQVKVVHTLECISNNLGGDLIGNARWTGVKLADVINKARPQQGVSEAIFRAADDYSDSVIFDDAVQENAMLVYEMNGQPLTQKHGYPARLLIPGIYGMKNLKWITEIELANYDFKGYWQKQGWDDPAPYQTTSRIDYPVAGTIDMKPLYVGGIAFAGRRGINRVEISLDGGGNWADAQLRRPLGPNTWVLWTFPWVPDAEGDHTIIVRATDGTGQLQTDAEASPYPYGSTGWDSVRVRVLN